MKRLLDTAVPTTSIFHALENVMTELREADKLQHEWMVTGMTQPLGTMCVEQKAVIYPAHCRKEGDVIFLGKERLIVLNPLLCGEHIKTRVLDFSFFYTEKYKGVTLTKSKETLSRGLFSRDRKFVTDSDTIIESLIKVLNASSDSLFSFK